MPIHEHHYRSRQPDVTYTSALFHRRLRCQPQRQLHGRSQRTDVVACEGEPLLFFRGAYR